jgi:hypothetical protein
MLSGVIFACIMYACRRTSGVLKIDRSNPEKDVYRFEVENLDDIAKKHYVVLTIDANADLSQK